MTEFLSSQKQVCIDVEMFLWECKTHLLSLLS